MTPESKNPDSSGKENFLGNVHGFFKRHQGVVGLFSFGALVLNVASLCANVRGFDRWNEKTLKLDQTSDELAQEREKLEQRLADLRAQYQPCTFEQTLKINEASDILFSNEVYGDTVVAFRARYPEIPLEDVTGALNAAVLSTVFCPDTLIDGDKEIDGKTFLSAKGDHPGIFLVAPQFFSGEVCDLVGVMVHEGVHVENADFVHAPYVPSEPDWIYKLGVEAELSCRAFVGQDRKR